jgi:antagonist of KipI
MLTTVQDLGRPGWSCIGVPIGGAADALSLRIGNRLVGNPDNAAALEMTMHGGSFLFDDRAIACIVGGEAQCFLDSRPVSHLGAIEIPPGSTLVLGPMTRGVRAYLCLAGGIEVPGILGSRSTYISATFGGHHGRALASADLLELESAHRPPRELPESLRPLAALPTSPFTLRVVPVDPTHSDDFWHAPHTVSNQSNRAGVRLHRHASPPFAPARSGRMISEGMPPGAIQLPPGGEPIILGPDHPTTGGYPVVGCVASVDLHLVGQLRPGEIVYFRPITRREALEALRTRERALDDLLPPIPPK